MTDPITIEPDNADKAALREAKSAMRILKSKLGRAKADVLKDFIERNFDAIQAYTSRTQGKKGKGFAASFDEALTDAKGTPEQRKNSLHWMTKTARLFIDNAQLAYDDLDIPPALKADIKKTLATKKSAASRSKASLRTLGKISRTFLSLTTIPHHGIHALADGYMAATAAIGLSRNKSRMALASLVVGLGATQAMPQSASPYADLFLDAAGAKVGRHDICNHFNVSSMDPVTTAFVLAMAPKSSDKDFAARQLHFTSAMRAVKQGVSPVALYLLSSVETGNFLSVDGPGTAEGPYQALRYKNIEMAVQHYKDSPAYQEAKARLSASNMYPTRDQDLSMTTALEGLAGAYKKNPAKVLEAFTSGRKSYEFDTAFKLAHSPVLSGDLMATEIKKHAPDLALAALKGQPLDELIKRTADYYTTHLPGAAGGAYLKFLAKKFPDIRMDSGAVAKHYNKKEFKGYDANFTSVGTHYTKMAKANQGVFKSGTSGTASQYIADIQNYVAKFAAPIGKKMAPHLGRNEGNPLACYTDPIAVLSQIPETTNGFEIAGLTAQKAYRDIIPGAARESISYAYDTALEGAQWAFATAAKKITAPPENKGDAVEMLIKSNGQMPLKL